MSTRLLKPGTRVRILFRPLKKMCEHYGWSGIYENCEKARGKSHDLVLKIETKALSQYDSKGKYGIFYRISMPFKCKFSCGDIPTTCFRVLEK